MTLSFCFFYGFLRASISKLAASTFLSKRYFPHCLISPFSNRTRQYLVSTAMSTTFSLSSPFSKMGSSISLVTNGSQLYLRFPQKINFIGYREPKSKVYTTCNFLKSFEGVLDDCWREFALSRADSELTFIVFTPSPCFTCLPELLLHFWIIAIS